MKKYLVIDAGGNRWPVEAGSAVEEVDEHGRRRVIFTESAEEGAAQIAAFSAPTSWGPAPPEKKDVPV